MSKRNRRIKNRKPVKFSFRKLFTNVFTHVVSLQKKFFGIEENRLVAVLSLASFVLLIFLSTTVISKVIPSGWLNEVVKAIIPGATAIGSLIVSFFSALVHDRKNAKVEKEEDKEKEKPRTILSFWGRTTLLVLLVLGNIPAGYGYSKVTEPCFGITRVDKTKEILVLFAKFEQLDPNGFPVNEWPYLTYKDISDVANEEKITLSPIDKTVESPEEAEQLNVCYGSILTIWGKVGKVSIVVNFENNFNADVVDETQRQASTVNKQEYDKFTQKIEEGVDPQYVLSILAGEIQLSKREWDKAIVSFTDAIEIAHKSPLQKLNVEVAYNERGIAYQHSGKIIEADTDFSEAMRTKPSYLPPLVNTALDYEIKGDKETAKKLYLKALQSDDKNVVAHNNLGCIYMDEGEYQAAEEQFDKAKDSDTLAAFVYYNKGILNGKRGYQEKAVDNFRQAISLGYVNKVVYLALGNSFLELKRYNESLNAYDQANRIDPDYVEAFVNRGYVYLQLKQYDDALRELNRAIKLDPNSSMAHLNLGHLYRLKVDLQMALTEFKEAMILDTKNAQATYWYGAVLHDMHPIRRNGMTVVTTQILESLKDMQEAIKLDPMDPKFPDPYWGLGVLYMELETGGIYLDDYAHTKAIDYLETYSMLINHTDPQVEQWIHDLKLRLFKP